MSDSTNTADLAAAPAPPQLPHREQQATGRLLKYRVTFEDGTIEVYDGHAVSQPSAGFVRIHRYLDGAWQMVFGGKAEHIRTVRAITGPEYDRMVKAQVQLNTALDHLGLLIAAGPDRCNYDVTSPYECVMHPQAGLTDEGECGVAVARKFLAALRPF